MSRSYLAFDLGAESGRAILGTLSDEGRLSLSELRRFPNGPRDIGGRLRWDARRLFRELNDGLRAAASGPPLDGIGVDTWGVDFALVDAKGELLEDPLAYRDPAFPPAMDDFLRVFPRERLYPLTGIQFLPLNTVYQIHALAMEKSSTLEDAESLLFMPDLFNLQLAGVRRTEATIASTSQLMDARTGGWQEEVLASLKARRTLFQDIVPPGTVLGPLCARAREAPGLGLSL